MKYFIVLFFILLQSCAPELDRLKYGVMVNSYVLEEFKPSKISIKIVRDSGIEQLIVKNTIMKAISNSSLQICGEDSSDYIVVVNYWNGTLEEKIYSEYVPKFGVVGTNTTTKSNFSAYNSGYNINGNITTKSEQNNVYGLTGVEERIRKYEFYKTQMIIDVYRNYDKIHIMKIVSDLKSSTPDSRIYISKHLAANLRFLVNPVSYSDFVEIRDDNYLHNTIIEKGLSNKITEQKYWD